MIYIGIDPGIKGAVATVYPDGSLDVFDLKDCYDGAGASQTSLNPNLFGEWLNAKLFGFFDGVVVFCELPIFVGGGFTIKTPMSMFESFGVLRALFAVRRIPFCGVRPIEWLRFYPDLYHPKRKRCKEESVKKAIEIYPQYAGVFSNKLQRGKNKGSFGILDGRAEAALIANYGVHLQKSKKIV